MKDLKKNKGITLVALVITIIIMLILAGVAINMAINSNGLFSKANSAVEKWNTAIENERSEIQDLLDILGVEESTTVSTELPAEWDSNKVSVVVTQGTRTAPVPKGYTVSGIDGENTISGGLVIYETKNVDTTTDGFWTNKDNDGYLTCQTTYNQYVWTPVDDINDMIMCKSNSSTSQCNLKLQPDGTLKCETHDSTDLCGRLYSTGYSYEIKDGASIITTPLSFTNADRATHVWDGNVGREPDITTLDEDDSYSMKIVVPSGKRADFQAQLINDFREMATSVAKYGGFYISRYEAGENGASKKKQKVILAGCYGQGGSYAGDEADPDSYISIGLWYQLYNALRHENNHMMWGSQYDQIMRFIGDDAQVAHPSKNSGHQKRTGYDGDLDILKNIYDLECNNIEYVATAGGDMYRCARGGNYNTVRWRLGSASRGYAPASHLSFNRPDTQDCYACSRATMYI